MVKEGVVEQKLNWKSGHLMLSLTFPLVVDTGHVVPSIWGSFLAGASCHHLRLAGGHSSSPTIWGTTQCFCLSLTEQWTEHSCLELRIWRERTKTLEKSWIISGGSGVAEANGRHKSPRCLGARRGQASCGLASSTSWAWFFLGFPRSRQKWFFGNRCTHPSHELWQVPFPLGLSFLPRMVTESPSGLDGFQSLLGRHPLHVVWALEFPKGSQVCYLLWLRGTGSKRL